METETPSRTLFLNGTIAEDSWFDDDVTPKLFKSELESGEGDITVWINSPGGDCIAAAQIYNMLNEYKGNVTIKIDGIAASAASVIAMAGDNVLMSPVSMLMIHNPATLAFGDHADMQKAIDMLNEVKESIINAYALKTGLSRAKLSHLMDEETWMDANKAVELGFADDIIKKDSDSSKEDIVENNNSGINATIFSSKRVTNALVNKLEKHYAKQKVIENEPVSQQDTNNKETGITCDELRKKLNIIEKYI